MVLKRTLFVLFIVVFYSCSTPPPKSDKTGKFNGVKIYEHYCVTCHGNKGDRCLSNASDLSNSKLSDEQIKNIILFGSDKGMGAYKSIIKEEKELDALIHHVKSLRKN